MTTRELYKAAYRNARCARSNDFRATLSPLSKCGDNRVVEFIKLAIVAREDRRFGEFGWVNYPRYVKFQKALRTYALSHWYQ